MKVGAIIQARTGSTRLPNKVLMPLKDKTVLEHVIDRVSQSKLIDEIIVATTTKSHDDKIIKLLRELKISTFRGSENNVLERYYEASKKYQLNTIVRITSDCPLIDPRIIDKVIHKFLSNNYDLVTNAGLDSKNRTFPRGLDVEVFSFDSLKNANIHGNKDYHKEHVTPFIYETSRKIHYFKQHKDYSSYRLTIDTELDYELIKAIYNHFYSGENDFYLEDIIDFLDDNPKIAAINVNIQQKKLARDL